MSLINGLANGLSAAGGAIAQTYGAAALEAQRAQLDNQKLQLADQLAGARESKGRAEADTYLARSQAREHTNRIGEQQNAGDIQERNNAAQSGREHINRIGEIEAQGSAEGKNIDRRATAEKGVAKYSHDISQGDTDKIISLDDDTQVRITKDGKASVIRYSDGVPLKAGGDGLTPSENRQFQSYLAEHTDTDELGKKVTDAKGAMEDIKTNNPQLYRKLRGERAASSPSPVTGSNAKPKGTGTKADPFQGTTQAEVDWFKASAPAGAVIVIDGKPYTK